jgi:PPOX class probable F420-dependent enzyme
MMDEVIWLTTVTPAGAPQPNPIWFYWDGEQVVITSQTNAYRLRNLAHNPKVS